MTEHRTILGHIVHGPKRHYSNARTRLMDVVEMFSGFYNNLECVYEPGAVLILVRTPGNIMIGHCAMYAHITALLNMMATLQLDA